MFCYFVPRDLFKRGFSASNGRYVSFMASFQNCYTFRTQRPFSPFAGNGTGKRQRKRKHHESSRDKAAYHVTSSLVGQWIDERKEQRERA